MSHFFDLLLLAAKKSSLDAAATEGKSLSLSWAVVLAGLIVGLLVTLSPTKRTSEIKRGREN